MPPTLLIDRSDSARFEISGAHAVTTLNGLVTNDVAALQSGTGQYAAVLTAKGKVVADVIILRTGDTLRLHTAPAAGPGLHAMLVKFINPRFATLRDVSASTFELVLVGADSPRVLERASGTRIGAGIGAEALLALPAYSSVSASVAAATVDVIHLGLIGADNLTVFAVTGARDSLESVAAAIRGAGAIDAEQSAIDTLRIEAGIPAWGIDMDENTLSQEANLDEMHAVSYTKGCYIGQETVARIHFRGHVNRNLRRLAFTGDVLPPRGAVLQDEEHRAVGDVRSATRSDRQGCIGIGMVRREIEDGAMLDVHWEGGGATALVAGKAKGAID